MKKMFAAFFSVLALLMSGTPFVSKEPEIKAEAVNTQRLYVVVTDQMLALATRTTDKFIFWPGTGSDTTLTKLPGDDYTYYFDGATGNNMAVKGYNASGTRTINLYSISNSGKGTTWDAIVFNASISTFDAPASGKYTTSVYTPPGATYSVSLYNGETIISTQTAFENVVFSPTPVSISGYIFQGWFTDSTLMTSYTPSVLSQATSLYGKYVLFDSSKSNRIYVTTSNSWWYNNSSTAISYWIDGETPSTTMYTMRPEPGGSLHSYVLPNSAINRIKLHQRDASGTNLWNSTGVLTIDLSTYSVTLFSGPLNANWGGPLTPSDYSDTAPDIAYLKTEVPLLSCTHYDNANTLLGVYNRLGNNELSLINALTVNSHDETPIALSYKSVIDYYAAYQNVVPPSGHSQIFQTSTRNNITLFSLLGLSVFALSSYYFIKKKKYFTD